MSIAAPNFAQYLRLLAPFPCARLRSVSTRKPKAGSDVTGRAARKPMSLKNLAEHLALSPATVSLVINRSPVADSIPQAPKDRISAPARVRPRGQQPAVRARESGAAALRRAKQPLSPCGGPRLVAPRGPRDPC